MTFDDLLARIAEEPRASHLLGDPLPSEEIQRWSRTWAKHPLPADLQELLGRADGIHLSADFDTGRAQLGIAPLAEWDLARTCMWGPHAAPEMLGDEYLAISYDADSAAYVVLDVVVGEYFLMDACGADEPSLIGADVAVLLDWLWARR